jgi:membrane-bound inhibitor of C-type lysozyme
MRVNKMLPCLRASLFSVLIWPLAVFAQSTSQPNASAIEMKPTPVNEIPAQYRADAPRPRKPFVVRYTCPESGRLFVTFDNAQQTATIESGNTTRYLKQGASGSGARYVNSDESYVFWLKGKSATINGRETCEAD